MEAYTPPDRSCDKILRIEKDGLWPVIEASRIADRYDMAVVVSEGYSARACRELLAQMPGRCGEDLRPARRRPGRVQHRADTGEATERMPHHSVDVIDLGLTVDTAIGLGLESEEFIRERALASTILPKLSDVALEWTRSSPPRMSS